MQIKETLATGYVFNYSTANFDLVQLYVTNTMKIKEKSMQYKNNLYFVCIFESTLGSKGWPWNGEPSWFQASFNTFSSFLSP